MVSDYDDRRNENIKLLGDLEAAANLRVRARVAETPRAWAGRRSPSNEKGPRAGPFHHAYSILAARAGRRCLREGLGSFHVLAGREVGRGPVRCRVGGALLGCELQDFDAPWLRLDRILEHV